MSGIRDRDLATVLGTQAREADALAQGEHLDADQLVAYHEGSASPAATQRAEEHLVACTVCAGLLGELVTGFDDDDPVANEVEHEASWRSLRAQLDVAPTPASPPLAKITPARSTILPWALAAVLLATVGGLLWQLSISNRNAERLRTTIATLTAPQAGVDTLYLDAVTRDLEAVPTVRSSPERPIVVLVLTPPPAVDGGEQPTTLGVELRDADDTTVFTASGLTVNDHGTLRLALSSYGLPPGDYRLRLLGPHDDVLDERTIRLIAG